MNEELKQSLIDLLASAKNGIETGDTQMAIEAIESAIAAIENDGVATTDGEDSTKGEDGKEEKPKPRPLPGQGTTGGLVP